MALRAGAIGFAPGFVFGAVRANALAPRICETSAVLIEAPPISRPPGRPADWRFGGSASPGTWRSACGWVLAVAAELLLAAALGERPRGWLPQRRRTV